jgi:hypothetical protein
MMKMAVVFLTCKQKKKLIKENLRGINDWSSSHSLLQGLLSSGDKLLDYCVHQRSSFIHTVKLGIHPPLQSSAQSLWFRHSQEAR